MKKLMLTIFLIHKFLDIAAAADTTTSSGSNNNNSPGLKIPIIVVASIVGIFVIGTCLYCFCCRRKSKRRGGKVGVTSRNVKESKKSKPRSGGATSSTSKINMRESDKLLSTPDVRLVVATNPVSLIQPSGTTTPSRVPPQTPLTPPQPQHSVIPSSTQTTLTAVSESLDSISHPTRRTSTEVVVTPEVSESHRPRSYSNIEQRDSPPQSRSSTEMPSRFSLPPTSQTYGQQHSEVQEFYPERTQSVESHLEQVTRSDDTSPYRQYHDYESQPFDTPLQTQSRGMDISLFTDAPNLPSSQQSFETSTDDHGEAYQETEPGQRQRASMPPYPVSQPPYDDSSIPGTPPERRGRPDSTYSLDDNPGSALPGRPLQRSGPGTSPRSRRGRRGGNR